jgi:hypothetical protein
VASSYLLDKGRQVGRFLSHERIPCDHVLFEGMYHLTRSDLERR